jgi:hypothetical protein
MLVAVACVHTAPLRTVSWYRITEGRTDYEKHNSHLRRNTVLSSNSTTIPQFLWSVTCFITVSLTLVSRIMKPMTIYVTMSGNLVLLTVFKFWENWANLRGGEGYGFLVAWGQFLGLQPPSKWASTGSLHVIANRKIHAPKGIVTPVVHRVATHSCGWALSSYFELFILYNVPEA